MKKCLTFLALFLLSGLGAFSQITLTYDKHALKAGDVQVMLKAAFIEAGPGGAKQVWNFSNLNIYGEEKSQMLDASTVEKYGVLPSATVAIASGSDFRSMFKITSNENDNVGYFGKDYHVVFTQPHRRMVYPFAYGDLYMSNLSGYGVYSGTTETDIAGDYSFEADAYGTLILPNDVLSNVLRVKSTYSKYEFARCFFSETHQTKYLYYTDKQRYPVFAVMETMWVNYNGDTSWHRSSAVNQSVYSDEEDMIVIKPARSVEQKDYVHTIFPNPFTDELKVDFELNEKTNAAVELYSMEGLKVGDICSKRLLNQGVHEFEYKNSALPAGTYFVKFIFNDYAFVKQVIKLK